MVASKTPWHAQHDSGGAYVTDGNGEVLGHFYDWRDAEIVVSLVNKAKQISARLEPAKVLSSELGNLIKA